MIQSTFHSRAYFLDLLAVAILLEPAGPLCWAPPPAPMLNMEPPAPACCWGWAAPNWGGEVTWPPKLGAVWPPAEAPPNVGAGAANVEPPEAPPPNGLALGAGALLPKLKAPEAAGAGGLWTDAPKLNAPPEKQIHFIFSLRDSWW